MSLIRLLERDVKISISAELSVPRPLMALLISMQSNSTGFMRHATRSFLKLPDVSLLMSSTRSLPNMALYMSLNLRRCSLARLPTISMRTFSSVPRPFMALYSFSASSSALKFGAGTTVPFCSSSSKYVLGSLGSFLRGLTGSAFLGGATGTGAGFGTGFGLGLETGFETGSFLGGGGSGGALMIISGDGVRGFGVGLGFGRPGGSFSGGLSAKIFFEL